MTFAQPEDEVVVQAFWKGTALPSCWSGKYKNWQEYRGHFDQCIVEGLRAGITIPKQKELYTQQMDLFESILHEYGKSGITKGGVIGEKGVLYLSEKLVANGWNRLASKSPTKRLRYIRHLWYMNLHCLIKFGAVKDDEDYGWIVMTEDMAEMMKKTEIFN